MSTPSTASVFSSSEEEYFSYESRSSSSSDDDDGETSNSNDCDNDALQVRQKAFDLLQKIGPDRNEAQEEWPMSPRLSYQHSGGGGARGSPPRRSASRSNSRTQQALPFPADYFPQSDMDDDDLDEPLPARLVTPRNSNHNHCTTNNSEANGNSWFPDSLVQCFSHACRVGANEIMAQHRQGYESIKEGAVILWNTDADQEARELLSGGREVTTSSSKNNKANGRGNPPLPRRARNNNSRSNAGNDQIAVKKRKQKAGTYLNTVSGYRGYS